MSDIEILEIMVRSRLISEGDRQNIINEMKEKDTSLEKYLLKKVCQWRKFAESVKLLLQKASSQPFSVFDWQGSGS